MNRQGSIVFWNTGAEQVFGYSADEMLGQPVTRLISERHKERHTKALNALLKGDCGAAGTIEFEAVNKDGCAFPFELCLSLWQQNGKFLGLAIGRDIGERKQMDQALRESAERYCNLFAASLEAVLSADIQNGVSASDEALEKLCSCCLKGLAEMKATHSLPPEHSEYISAQVDEILNADEPASSIVRRILSRDGKRILIEQYLDLIKREGASAAFQDSHRDVIECSRTGEQTKSSLMSLARVVSRLIESCDPHNAKHQQKVAELAWLVGENMGLADDVVERLYFNGLLHDVGKIAIPTSIRTKPGRLTEEEWAIIRAHARLGHNILKEAGFPRAVLDAALRHHERLDGSGYPDGITGDKLSLEVSILAVCDVVEAMSSHRPYRPERTKSDILRELTDGRGAKYNAVVVDMMLPMIETGEYKSIWNRKNSRGPATEDLYT
jgi:PAS domain S-box-containing protein/putative nucleotidyltransferase with HDIG domain